MNQLSKDSTQVKRDKAMIEVTKKDKFRSEVQNLTNEIFNKNNEEIEANVSPQIKNKLISKIVVLSNYLSKISKEVDNKQQVKELLEKKIYQLNSNYKKVQYFDNDKSIITIKEFNSKFKSLKNENDRLKAKLRNKEPPKQQLINKLESQKVLLGKRSKENKVLILLNTLLKRRLLSCDSNINLLQYSHLLFKKGQKMNSQTNNLCTSIEDLQKSEQKLNFKCHDLSSSLKSVQVRLDNSNVEIERLNAIIMKKQESLDKYELKSVMDVTGKKNLQKLSGFVNNLQQKTIVRDLDNLKEVLSKKIKSEALAQAKVSKLETQYEILTKMNDGLKLQYSQLLKHKMNGNTDNKSSFIDSNSEKLITKKLQRENQLLKERISVLIDSLSTIRDHFMGKDTVNSVVAQKIDQLRIDINNQLSDLGSIPFENGKISSLEIENLSLKSKNEMQIQIHGKQILQLRNRNEVLRSYTDILEYKSQNSVQIMKDFAQKVETLEKERESMKANSLLEKLKDYMEQQNIKIEEMKSKYEVELENSTQVRRKAVSEAQDIEAEFQILKAGKIKEFNIVKKDIEDQFDQVMSSVDQKIKDVCEKRLHSIKSKEDELSELESKLRESSFEGKEELVLKMESLLKENKDVKGELLSTLARMEMIKKSQPILIKKVVERVKKSQDQRETISLIENKLHKSERLIKQLQGQILGLQNQLYEKTLLESKYKKEILTIKNDGSSNEDQVKLLQTNISELKKDLNKKQSEYTQLEVKLKECQLLLQENEDKNKDFEKDEQLLILTNEMDKLKKEKLADKETIEEILKEWKETYSITDLAEKTQKMEELRTRLEEWMSEDEHVIENGLTVEQMMEMV